MKRKASGLLVDDVIALMALQQEPPPPQKQAKLISRNGSQQQAQQYQKVSNDGNVYKTGGIKKVKVNNVEIVKPDIEEKEEHEMPFIPGVIPDPTPSIAILGPRGQGKTSVIFNFVTKWLEARRMGQPGAKMNNDELEQSMVDPFEMGLRTHRPVRDARFGVFPAHAKGMPMRQDQQHHFESQQIIEYLQNNPKARPKYMREWDTVPSALNQVVIFASTVHDDKVYRELTKPVVITKRVSDEEIKEVLRLTAKDALRDKTIGELLDEVKKKHPAITERKIEVPNPWVIGYDDIRKWAEVNQLIEDTNQEIDYYVVVDDFSKQLRYNPDIPESLKVLRHYASCSFATQYIHDLSRDSRVNFDYYVLLPYIDDAKLMKIHEESGTTVPYPVYKDMYKDATPHKGSFLFVDKIRNRFFDDLSVEYDVSQYN